MYTYININIYIYIYIYEYLSIYICICICICIYICINSRSCGGQVLRVVRALSAECDSVTLAVPLNPQRSSIYVYKHRYVQTYVCMITICVYVRIYTFIYTYMYIYRYQYIDISELDCCGGCRCCEWCARSRRSATRSRSLSRLRRRDPTPSTLNPAPSFSSFITLCLELSGTNVYEP